MKKKSIIIMTILSLVLVVGCCYHQQYTMNCNYDMPVSECPAMVTNSNVKDGDYMYYCIYESIYKVNVHTKKSSLVYKSDKLYWYYNLDVKDGWIYGTAKTVEGTDIESPYIFRVRTNGKDAELFTKGINPIIYKGSIYYQKLDFPEEDEEYYCKSLGIHKMSLSGKNDVCINDSEYISQFTIYNSNIYYIDVDYTGNRDYYEEYYSLKSMDMNGDSQKTIFEGEKDSIINGLVAYSDDIYFNQDDCIYKIKIGSSEKKLVLQYSSIMQISDGYMYYIDMLEDEGVFIMNLNDKTRTCLMEVAYGVEELQISNGYIIYSDGYESADENERAPYNMAKYFCKLDGKDRVLLKGYVRT